ncbi:MAG: zinc ribbon domain-containing protein [Clostridia bacterium]|nr:zinc ribbon domain-containing protein [Clostridia bacterium]
MAKCPKCGNKLRIFDISQFCPKCGVNMRFYNFEENFIREAKYSELSQAGLKVKLRNLKYSFSGSKLVTAKLIVMLLPVLSMLIPSGSFTVNAPFVSIDGSFGLLGIVNTVMGGTLSYILSMCSSAVTGAAFTALRNALICVVAALLCAVFCFLFSLLGFISIKNMQKITAVTALLGAVLSVVSLVMIGSFASISSSDMLLSGKMGFGLIVSVIMFAAVFVVNLMLWKQGIHPVYDEGVEERVRIFKEVKAGRINIDDLPQPVVETEATRKIEEEIAKEEAAFFESLKKSEKEE